MIDFEFLQPYRGEKPLFERAFEFEGVPAGAAEYARPKTGMPKCIRHHRNWSKMPFEEYFEPVISRLLGGDADAGWPCASLHHGEGPAIWLSLSHARRLAEQPYG